MPDYKPFTKEHKMFNALGNSNNLFRNAANVNRSLVSYLDPGFDMKPKEEQFKLLHAAAGELETYAKCLMGSLEGIRDHFEEEE